MSSAGYLRRGDIDPQGTDYVIEAMSLTSSTVALFQTLLQVGGYLLQVGAYLLQVGAYLSFNYLHYNKSTLKQIYLFDFK